MLIQSCNNGCATECKIYFFLQNLVFFFLHCLQQCVMHIFCWAMDQSHYPKFQDTGTTQQQDTRAFKTYTSLLTQTQLGAVKI